MSRTDGAASAPSFRSRMKFLAAAFLIVFGIITVQLVRVQVLSHKHFLEKARASHLRQRTLSAARGSILDRNGTPLAMCIPEKSVFADPVFFQKNFIVEENETNLASDKELAKERKEKLKKARQDCKKLANALGLDASSLWKQLNSQGRYVRLKRAVPEDVQKKIDEFGFKWVGFEDLQKRVYPNGNMAAQTLGFVSIDGKGLEGLEASCNARLSGKPGKISLEVDRKGREIAGLHKIRIPPQKGKDLKLTIDVTLQQIAEAALSKGIREADAARGTALVMDPCTGDILALASQPAFDPNSYKEFDPKRWTNPAVVGAYEPGSTFKLVVACAALEEGSATEHTKVNCTGEKTIGKRTIHCALHDGSRAHGKLDLEGIIEKSCNVGAATLALQMGKQNFANYVEMMGFGQKTGIELYAESTGYYPSASQWSDIRAANISFGQGISVTPLQLLKSYSIVANGGLSIHPHLLLDEKVKPAKRVLSTATAEQMRKMLVKVVESGTGETAAIEGYSVAGKTGTAQKPLPGVGYKSGKYIGSFIGFVPAEKPMLAILVIIDEPTASHYGGVVAAPVFREIAKQGLLYLDIPPSEVVAAAD